MASQIVCAKIQVREMEVRNAVFFVILISFSYVRTFMHTYFYMCTFWASFVELLTVRYPWQNSDLPFEPDV